MSIERRRPLLAAAAALCLAALALPAPCAAQAAPGELVIIRDYDDVWKLDRGLRHAIALKKAGVDVRVIFQDDAVLVPLVFPLQPPGAAEEKLPEGAGKVPGKRLDDTGAVDLVGKKPGDLSPLGNPRGVTVRYRIYGKEQAPSEYGPTTYPEFKALGIPYTVSAASADALGVYEKLQAKGEPLSADRARQVDISPLVKAGYRVTIF